MSSVFAQFVVDGSIIGLNLLGITSLMLLFGASCGYLCDVLVSSIVKLIVSVVYDGVSLRSIAGEFVPFIAAICLLVLLCNLIGLIPYSFALTAQFSFGLLISLGITIGRFYLGLKVYGSRMLELLIPSGTPFFLWPFLVLVELIGFLLPGVSLGLRLGVNVMSGHILLSVLFTALFGFSLSGSLLGILSILLSIAVVALILLELFISIVQAYVFALLSSVYIGEFSGHNVRLVPGPGFRLLFYD